MALLKELQRRKVIRAAAVYVVAAWLLLQIADTLGSILTLPDWFQRVVLATLVIGFPIALILAWTLELTPDGLARDSAPASGTASRVVDYGLLLLLIGGVSWFAIDRLRQDGAVGDIDKSVAVLMFNDLSSGGGNSAFTAGVHADLLQHLARIRSIRTVSRTTILKYQGSTLSAPQIANELGVATVVEGDVQRMGNSVRVNVQLINADTDEPLWTQAFDRELTAGNVFAIQGEIARAVADRLQAALTADDQARLDVAPTQSLAALDAYFIGKGLLDTRMVESLRIAIEHFERAVEHDPGFALAWSGLADSYMLLPEYSHNADRELVNAKSREALLRAMALDPSLPEVRSTEAWYQLTRNYDWAGAEAIFSDSLQDFPDNTNLLHWMSHTLSWQGRQEEGLALARHALDVEPDSHLMQMNVAYILTDAGRYEEAQRIAREVRDRFPSYLAQRRNLFLHELRAGYVAEAGDSFVTYTTIIGGDRSAARAIADMFVAYADDGTIGDISDELKKATLLGSEDLAQVLAYVGDSEGTLAALDAAIDERSGSRSVLSMKINPAYDFIRDDPRFIEMLTRVGLADSTGP
jgi:TolB-like protein/Flp pilus assembly protein TadD